MIDFEIAQRLVRMQERLRHATYHRMREDGHHKSAEGAMELCFHMPPVVGDDREPQWSVWAYSYLLCPDGRDDRWFGCTPLEAISKAEDAIGKWCLMSEMEMFEAEFEPRPHHEQPPPVESEDEFFGSRARPTEESDTERAPIPPADARLAEIRERVEKATPGPWQISTCDDGSPMVHTIGDVICVPESNARSGRDLDFLCIAHAREDVPFLLTEVDRLAARVKEMEGALRPFAKAGELFPEPPGTVEFDQCIYMPGAGAEYAISGEHLRVARARLQPEEEGHETLLSCGEWAVQTFGRATIARALERAEEELSEAKQASGAAVMEEIADTVICLAAAAHAFGGDLQSVINAKMAVNRARKWKVLGDGTGYHVREAPAQPEEEGR